MNEQVLERRKADHIRINLDEDVASLVSSGLERYRFMHEALPELDAAAINLSQTLFGKQLRTPLLISSMTGGTGMARQINLNLAAAAQQTGAAMGVGSVRAAVAHPELADSFRVRAVAPDILLFANIGAVQLNYGFDAGQCLRAVELLGADGLILHLNPLQEILQPEGDGNWAGLLDKMAEVVAALHFAGMPVVVKEVGWGISPRAARALAGIGVDAIDVAGAGGTSWSQVEMHRAQTAVQRRVAQAFAGWGIPTAESIGHVRAVAPDTPVFASGGLVDGVDGAKCIALGATLFGMARPLLKAATENIDAVLDEIAVINGQLRAAMLCAAAPDLATLRRTALLDVGAMPARPAQ